MAVINKQDSDHVKSGLDKNKSSLTHRITAGASTYLSERGFKPIETEVGVSDHWISDLASVVVPTHTELQKMKLIPRKPAYSCYFDGWADKSYEQSEKYKKHEIKIAKQQKKIDDWYKIAEAVPKLLTALVEVKISRGDFIHDSKWTRSSPTNLRYLAIPCGMLKRNEYPAGWWVIECGASGQVQRLAQEGTLENINTEQKMWTIHNIAIRRHHRTEYKWQRDITKQFNAQQTVTKQNYRVANIVKAVLDIAGFRDKYHPESKNPKECFKSHGIDYDRLSHLVKDDINKIWSAIRGKCSKDKH